MDILNFFNSPDVAKHCRDIGHTFNAFECAVIISQCYTKTFEEKLAAYSAIIDEYPDMEIPGTWMHEKPTPSFHASLLQIIEYENQMMNKFLEQETNAFYQFKLGNLDASRSYEYETIIINSYKKALRYAFETARLDNGCDIFGKALYNIAIRKIYLDRGGWYDAKISELGKIIDLKSSFYIYGVHEQNPTELLDCYINIPVPFKKGDLLEDDSYGNYMGNLFVLQFLSCDSPNHETKVMRSDTSDMTAYVYYLNDDQVNCEHMHFYPNLRYSNRRLKGSERIMKFVSLYVQGKICLCELLGIQKYLAADKQRVNEMNGTAIKWGGNLDEDSKKLLFEQEDDG